MLTDICSPTGPPDLAFLCSLWGPCPTSEDVTHVPSMAHLDPPLDQTRLCSTAQIGCGPTAARSKSRGADTQGRDFVWWQHWRYPGGWKPDTVRVVGGFDLQFWFSWGRAFLKHLVVGAGKLALWAFLLPVIYKNRAIMFGQRQENAPDWLGAHECCWSHKASPRELGATFLCSRAYNK